MEKLKQDLIEEVINEMTTSIWQSDYEAIEELLSFIPVENLIEYLPEEFWEKYKPLRNESI